MKKPSVLIIFLTVFIDLVGFGIIIPILPLYATQHGATPFQLGALLASYSVMQFVFAPILGSLSDRVGRKPVLAASLLGTSVASVALGVASSLPGALWLLFVARLLDGVTGANIATAQAYIADVTTPEKRARGMGLIGMAFGLGFVLGPAIGGLLAQVHIALPFYAVGALAFLNAVLMLAFLPEPERRLSVAVEARSRFARLSVALRDPNTSLLLVVFLLVTTAFAIMESTLALLLRDRFAYGPSEVAYVFAFVGLVMAIVQGGLVGRLAERVGERPLILLGAGLLAVALCLLAAPLPASPGLLLGAVGILATGVALHNPSVTGLVSRLAPASAQGTTLGVTQSMGSLGRIAGPLLGGALYGAGWSAPYYFGAAVMAIAALLAAYYNATVAPPIAARS
jgi:DHA1 family tetracycline resistance protein-like MFS transporter